VSLTSAHIWRVFGTEKTKRGRKIASVKWHNHDWHTCAFQTSAKLCVSTWNVRVLSHELRVCCSSCTLVHWCILIGQKHPSQFLPEQRKLYWMSGCCRPVRSHQTRAFHVTTHTHSMWTHTVLRNARVCQLWSRFPSENWWGFLSSSSSLFYGSLGRTWQHCWEMGIRISENRNSELRSRNTRKVGSTVRCTGVVMGVVGYPVYGSTV
jgi:hypothetical protein